MFGTGKAELRAIVAVQDCTIRFKDVLLKSRAKQIESLTRSRDELAAKVAELTAEVERLRQKPEKRETRQVEHLSVKPTDSFIVSYDRVLPQGLRERLRDGVEAFRSGKVPVLVLEGGLKVTVVSREPAAEPDDEGWTEWNGGACPVSNPNVKIDVRFRNGVEHRKTFAGDWRWSHRNVDSDIVAYRVVP